MLVIVKELNGKYIFPCVLKLLNLRESINGKVQDKKLKFLIQTFLSKHFNTKIFYQNILQKMGRRNSYQMILNC